MSLATGMPAYRLIVGLGNPGREYDRTRHNVGFMVLDLLAREAGADFRPGKGWKADVARAGEVHLCKPQTYMNLSGQAVRTMSAFYKIPQEQILVVLDDMALPLGKLRLRPSGSAGGHNGLRSIIEQMGTQEIARLRVGIGDAHGDAIGHVLGRFSPAEEDGLAEALYRSTAAIACVQEKGLPAAMNLFN